MIHADAIDPGVEASVAFELVGIVEGAQEGFLKDVESILPAIEEARERGEQPVLIPMHQHAKRFDISPLKGPQQMFFISFVASIGWTR